MVNIVYKLLAYKDGEIITRNFELLVEELLEAGSYVGIATHDERLVWSAVEIIERLGLAPEQYEFQMLLGVDEELRRIIRDAATASASTSPSASNGTPTA